MFLKKLLGIWALPLIGFALPLDQIDDFSLVFETVKSNYVDEISEEQLMKYAISGMINQLDPHSEYMDIEAMQQLDQSTNGKFGGLGLELSVKSGMIEIMSVVEKSPAWDAQLEPHDIILSIDGTFTQGMSLKEASSKIRGEPGTLVTLTVLKHNNPLPIEIKLERMIIKIPSVKSDIIDQQWAYLKVSVFGQKTAADFSEKLQSVLAKKPRGLLIDLRNNPGGLLRAATAMTNCLLDEKLLKDKTIVFAKGRNNQIQIKESASGEDMTKGLPIVVLVNQGSASASEIMAGALQDHHRAVVVGEQTFGKGSVQTVIPVNGKALKLTSSRYFTPSGRSIQATGITPDIVVSSEWQKVEPEARMTLKEANLNKHLETPEAKQSTQPDGALTETQDYQLMQALQTLKALSLMGPTR